jgi:glucose 1-dehydrogenase
MKRMMSFENKTAIVTGAGQGIGLEICRLLCDLGANVILNDADESLAINAAKKISDGGKSCLAAPGDCSDQQFINTMIEKAVSAFGRLDIAIANAGITLFGDFFSYAAESFNRVMQVNLFGSFFLAQAAANQMKKQTPAGGSLLFTSSVTGHQAHKNLAAYGMSKAALEMLAKNLVIELSPFNINVNTIAPGATITERTLHDPGYEAIWSKLTPLGRPATVTDIAESAVFLVSDKARHVTGQSLVVDGGWTSVSPSPYEQG